MQHVRDLIDDLREPTRALRRAIPQVWAGFTDLHGAAVADGPRAWAAYHEFADVASRPDVALATG